MPLFPPEASVTVIVDGRPLATYARAYLADGRVYAPVIPLLTRVADRLWLMDDTLVIERDGHRISVRMVPRSGGAFEGAYVPAAGVLRSLGAQVRYDAATRRLIVSVRNDLVVASPTPFNPAFPAVAPNPVFTPAIVPTPRPIWTGSPLPRRTALPFPPP